MSENLPVFSVAEEGDAMVVETPTPPPERLPRGTVRASVIAATVWCLLAAFWPYVALGDRPFSGWYVAVIIALFMAAGVLTAGIAAGVEKRYGQDEAALRVAGVSAYLGIGAGGVAATAALAAHFGPGLGAGVFSVLPGVVGALCLIRAPFAAAGARGALRYARSRQAAIAHLRRYGRRSPGRLTSVRFRNRWQQGRPEFVVDVACPLGVLRAHMITWSDRVPLAGSPVVVVHAPGDPSSVLIDLGAGARFEADAAKYREPAG
ncbi:hypothetical protein AB0I28_23515 [Phytomonospora sp. NPDC050363]|uniref:hypothetical protein n=1 Tax=Phytomonospora sp. NPDC050363 TaxID=3155642 RepID=UPI0033FFBA1A